MHCSQGCLCVHSLCDLQFEAPEPAHLVSQHQVTTGVLRSYLLGQVCSELAILHRRILMKPANQLLMTRNSQQYPMICNLWNLHLYISTSTFLLVKLITARASWCPNGDAITLRSPYILRKCIVQVAEPSPDEVCA